MINKLKNFFLNPTKIRSITSISIITIFAFSFMGVTIAGSFLNKNSQTIFQIAKISEQFDLNKDKVSVNGIDVGSKNWIILLNYFGDQRQDNNPCWLMLNGDLSSHKYWNDLYSKGDLYKIEDSYQSLNKILEVYESQSSLFANMITTNNRLNYDIGSNSIVMPIGITLTIVSAFLTMTIVWIHINKFKNYKNNKIIREDDDLKPNFDDDILF